MPVPLFKDLEKSADELLGGGGNKDFKTSTSLKIKTKAADSKIDTELTESSKKISCEMPPLGGATKQKFSVCSGDKDQLSYEMEADNMLVDGLMVKFSTKETVANGPKGPDNLTCDYKTKSDQYSAQAVVKMNANAQVEYNVSGVGAYESGLFGLQLLGSSKSGEALSGANAALGYSASDLSLVMKTNDMFKGANIFAQYKVDSSTTLGMKVAGTMAMKEAPSFTVGGKWEMDKSTTLGFKMCTDNVLGLSLSQKLMSNLNVVTAAEIPMDGAVKIGAAFTLSN